MSSLKYLHWSPARPAPLAPHPARAAAVASLRRASALCARWAQRLAHPARSARPADPQLEFYAEAGAPEGALFLDGQLVGWLPGVQRL
jgi:hypothetical protein